MLSSSLSAAPCMLAHGWDGPRCAWRDMRRHPPPPAATLPPTQPPRSPSLNRLTRRKYGLLEKKKDYVLRARDFHRKEKALKSLKRKAEERNPDEFYFAMENAATNRGVHIERWVGGCSCVWVYVCRGAERDGEAAVQRPHMAAHPASPPLPSSQPSTTHLCICPWRRIPGS